MVGQYQVNYADKSSELIPIVYGEHARDWWWSPGAKEEVKSGKIAWKGENDASKTNQASLRLYSVAWTNPHPDRAIESILFSSNKTRAAPFLVAVTGEK